MQWWRFRRRIHVSWLVAIWSVAVVGGVVMAQWTNGWYSVPWVVVAVLLSGCALWAGRLFMVPLLLVGGCIGGLVRGSIDQQQLAVYRPLYQQVVQVSGTVSDDVDTDKQGNSVLRVSAIRAADHELPGKVWVSARTTYDIKRGDIVTVRGKLQVGFGTFAGVVYRATIVHVQRPDPGDVARRVRDWFADAVRRAIPDPQAALGVGYLVGQRRSLPSELDEALKVVGLTHVVVASGYNLTILVRLARRLFVRVSKYLSTLSASVMIAAFVAITGASPSMARAGFVAGVSLAAWYYGRQFHPLVLLPFAAMVTVLIDPSFAWNDLGWQLSFGSFAGVMLLAPLLQAYFYGDAPPGVIRQVLGETVAAFCMTAPIIMVTFGQISNVAIIANVLVLPLIPLAMLLTFIAGIGALIMPGIATLLGLPATWLLGYMVWVAKSLAALPWAVTELQIAPWVAGVLYALMSVAMVGMWRVTRHDLRGTNIVE